MADYDLAIIGGGINGVSVARDAAGRGLRVLLLEQGDLGGAASSATSRLIHGDLSVLERRGFPRVRTQLAERDVWLRIAPHVVRPIRFALPGHAEERALLRSILWLCERMITRSHLPPPETIDVTHHPVGDALKRPFGTAFEFSDCVVDDARLVVLTALDAAERGAVIRTGARCVRADRDKVWRLAVIDRGRRQVITARALANASGGWTGMVADTILRMPFPKLAAVQIGQIVVRRLFDSDNVYVFQNTDGRLIFASPYERDFTLIGSITHAFTGDPAIVAVGASDVSYLCEAANLYFRERVEPADVVRSVTGVNLVPDRGGRAARDGSMMFDDRRGKAPLLTLFGGDITTARLRAERAVSKLTPHYPMSPRWTANAPLPGGDFAWDRFDWEVVDVCDRWRFLTEAQAQRLVGAYGKRVAEILGDTKSRADLGASFGEELTEAEVRHLMTKEWARFPDDILWRRTKLGLTMSVEDQAALAAHMTKGV
jgi:glycerol-3-phosphate dehydrogenase